MGKFVTTRAEVVWVDPVGIEHVQDLEFGVCPTWEETVKTVTTILRLRWGSGLFKGLVRIGNTTV